jgi:hypothetical protein
MATNLKSIGTFACYLTLLFIVVGFSGNEHVGGTTRIVQCDSLHHQLKEIKLSILKNYFCDTVGNGDINKYGFIFIVSEPYSFENTFMVNEKQFRFENPPYHQLFVSNLLGTKVKRKNKGRHAYFIHDNISHSQLQLPDTLKVTFHKYQFTGEEGRKGQEHNWERNKVLISSHYFLADSAHCKWKEITAPPNN